MKRFIKGILIVTLLLFIGGLGCVIAGFVMGISSGDLVNAFQKLPFIDFDKKIIFTGDNIIEFPDGFDDEDKEAVGGSQSFSKEAVKSLELDLAGVNCSFYQTEDDQILISSSDNNKVNIRLRGDRLEIERDTEIFGTESIRMEIYLPQDLYLKEFDLQAGAGNIRIDCPIWAGDVSMEIGASSVHMNGKITTDRLSVELGAGNASFSLVDAGSAEIENGAGQIELDLFGQKDSYNVTIESAAGSVQYGEETFSGLADTYENRPKDAERSVRIESALGQVLVTFKEEV